MLFKQSPEAAFQVLGKVAKDALSQDLVLVGLGSMLQCLA